VSGINGVPWDAVELPSQFMENWCWQEEALQFISGHYETGEPLPKEMLTKMLRAKNFQAGMQMIRQLEFAIFDFRIHAEKEANIQVILNKVREEYSVVPCVPFNRFQHDGGTKTLFGQTGNFDGDQAIDIVLQQPAAARFIARKLIRFYVWDERELTDEWVEPIAATLRENQFEIRPALRQIFTSRIFHAADTRGAKIKSPVELGVGVLRQLRAAINMNELANRMQELGQLPFHPPSVKGWDGGRTWINAATILSRANLVEHIVRSGQTKFADGDLAAWYRESKYNDVADLASHWLAVELAPEIIRELARTIPAGQTVTPNQVASAMTQLAVLPEFQLN